MDQKRGLHTPVLITYLKWATAGIIGVVTVCGAAGWLIVTAVKWGAAPLIRVEAQARQDESRARQSGDSLIVSRIEALSDQVQLIAAGLRVGADTPTGERLLNAAGRVEPRAVALPDAAKSQTEKP